MNRWKKSLKLQLIAVVLFATVLSGFAYGILYRAGDLVLEKAMESSEFVREASNRKIAELADYVQRNKIAADDTRRIANWEHKQTKVPVFFMIYQGQRLCYESLESSMEERRIQEQYYRNGAEKTVQFANGEGKVYLTGYFDTYFYTISNFIEFILAVILFFLVLLMAVKKKIEYIEVLEQDIKVLETGGLRHEVHVEGEDELASLANELNQMRISLYENIQREETITKANHNLVVCLAHDLRTPLTALNLYLKLLKNKSYESQQQKEMYIEKSLLKAIRIQRMTEQLFEHFVITGADQFHPEPPQTPAYIFDDLLSDMVGYLSEQEFQIESHIEWSSRRLVVSMEYIGRIIDNISSNLLKYADRREPVEVKACYNEEKQMLIFSNKILWVKRKPGSTGVGMLNIQEMMKSMEGSCQIYSDDTTYEICLSFPYAEKSEDNM